MFNATLVERTNITDMLILIRVKPDEGVVKFQPGQYLALGLPVEAKRGSQLPPEECLPTEQGLIKRSYSISSSPDQTEYYEFYIAILPQGKLTARLVAMQSGDRMFIGRKPVGTFTLAPVPAGAEVICFATGTGLAPFISMVTTAGVLDSYNSFKIVHGVRFSQDFAYVDLLQNMAKQYTKFSFLQTVSRADSNWTGSRGYVQDFIKSGQISLNPETQHIMLCGNPAMIDTIESQLNCVGFTTHSKKTPGNLHIERYW